MNILNIKQADGTRRIIRMTDRIFENKEGKRVLTAEQVYKRMEISATSISRGNYKSHYLVIE